MKKLTSIITSLLLILALTTVHGPNGAFAQEAGNSTDEVECDFSERTAWIWGLLGLPNAESAPSSIYFVWPPEENPIYESAPFYSYEYNSEPGIEQYLAYYRTINNLDVLPLGWAADENTVSEDQEAILFYECPEPTVTPTPTSTLTPTIEATVTPTSTVAPTATFTPTVVPTTEPTLAPTEGITPTVDVSPTPEVSPTSEVTPTITEEPSVTNNPSPTNEPLVTPVITETSGTTPTPTEIVPTTTASPTATPASNSSGVGGTNNNSSDDKAEQLKSVLGSVTSMAKTGSLEQIVMIVSGIFGMLFTAAGSLIYAKRKK